MSRRRGTASSRIDISGFRFAWNVKDDAPQLVNIDGEPWLPVFGSVDELDACMKELHIASYRVVTIHSAREFLVSMAKCAVRVCTNLRNEDDHARFVHVTLGLH